MAQRRGNLDRFQPVKGLITEASESNFPQDAAYDIENMEILSTGLTQRRLGLDIQENSTPLLPEFTLEDKNLGVFSTYKWEVVANGVEVVLRVLQNGANIRIIQDTTPLSAGFVFADIDLRDDGYTTGRPIKKVCQYAASAGFLIIVNEDANPVVVENTGTAGGLELTPSPLDLVVRTRELLPDTDSTQQMITATREFNLRNAGWPDSATVAENKAGTKVKDDDPLRHFKDIRGVYPTNSILYNSMKLSSAEEVEGVGAFSPWEDLKINFGNTSPPLGRFIHSAFSFDARTLLLTLDVDTIQNSTYGWTIPTRPGAVGFLNGHAFYGDVDQEGKARILVSQIATEVANLARCHQDADPTAAEINDLVATDGFLMRPTGMAKPVAMRETSKGLIILASNGVWLIKGVGGPFSATNFEITKLGAVSFNSPNSVAVVNDVVVFAGENGIYSITANQFGELELTNLTDKTIRTRYIDYGLDQINKMAVAFIESQNYVYWTVPEEQDALAQNSGNSFKVLILNLELGGFFEYTFSDEEGRPALHLPIALQNRVEETVLEPVTINGSEVVTTLAGEAVTIETTKVTTGKDTLGFLVSYNNGGTEEAYLATLENNSFTDWQSLGAPYEFNYVSFIEFAHIYPASQVGGMSAPYVHSFFQQGRNVDEPLADVVQELYRVYQTPILILEQL